MVTIFADLQEFVWWAAGDGLFWLWGFFLASALLLAVWHAITAIIGRNLP